jgi:hypothetical protein
VGNEDGRNLYTRFQYAKKFVGNDDLAGYVLCIPRLKKIQESDGWWN